MSGWAGWQDRQDGQEGQEGVDGLMKRTLVAIALHRHDRYRTIIAIVGGDLTLVAADSRKTVAHYETGKAYWQTPMPPGEMHKDVNETNRTIELVVVEMK